MSFIIKGNLRGLLCSDCELPLSGNAVKVYKPFDRANETRLAVADTKQTFHQVTDAELKEKEKLFIAEGSLQDNGDFVIEIGEKSGYEGGALDVDWYCGNTPIKIGPGHKKDLSLQFHITTLQPAFKQSENNDHVAFFEYKIDSKWFCRILTLLDIWVVCGVITDCETKKAIAGVKVFAYDVDLIQDDFLGNAYTDFSGKFTIVYPGANFRQTLLSPFLNVEWPAGPDYYFRVESSSGTVLLQEDRTRGRQTDRHNAHNCFCVKLCVKYPSIIDPPWFTSVGEFNITSDIDASGKTLFSKPSVTGTAGGVGYGFFGIVNLKGYATKKVPTAPSSALYYRFRYSLDNVNFNNVASAQMDSRLKVATRQITWNGTTAFQDVIVDTILPASPQDSVPADNYPNPILPHIINPDANGWIRVDQPAMDNGFYGPLVRLNTNTIINGGSASAGLTPGHLVDAPDQKNGKILYLQFQTTDDPANPASTNLNTQSIIGKIYVNNWDEVNLLKLEELYSNGSSGCSPVKTTAHIDYTIDHELLDSWAISVWSNATGNVTGFPSGNVARGAASQIVLNNPPAASSIVINPLFENWPSCAYMLRLVTYRKLTTGDDNDHGKDNPILFCR